MALPLNQNLVANMMDNLHYDIHAAHVTVKPNGQLTVFPVPCQGGSEFAISRHLGLLKDDYAVLNPAVREFLAIYWDRRKAAYWDPIYTGLFDSIMTLDWGTLTRLEMVRLAAKYKVLPYRHRYSWWEPDAPLHTVSVGDIGYVLRQDRRDTWSPIELKYACGIQVAHNSGVMDASAVMLTTGGHTRRATGGLVSLCTLVGVAGFAGSRKRPTKLAISERSKHEHIYVVKGYK
ncbi:hypothetical protein FRC09_003574 [Ceratobasidium sp. 395]|nr:hypothetical protein FRC09_003574 [Ceratobasidium sp. 395]